MDGPGKTFPGSLVNTCPLPFLLWLRARRGNAIWGRLFKFFGSPTDMSSCKQGGGGVANKNRVVANKATCKILPFWVGLRGRRTSWPRNEPVAPAGARLAAMTTVQLPPLATGSSTGASGRRQMEDIFPPRANKRYLNLRKHVRYITHLGGYMFEPEISGGCLNLRDTCAVCHTPGGRHV